MRLLDEKEGMLLFIETSKVCKSPLGDQANEKKTVAGCLGSKYKNLFTCLIRDQTCKARTSNMAVDFPSATSAAWK